MDDHGNNGQDLSDIVGHCNKSFKKAVIEGSPFVLGRIKWKANEIEIHLQSSSEKSIRITGRGSALEYLQLSRCPVVEVQVAENEANPNGEVNIVIKVINLLNYTQPTFKSWCQEDLIELMSAPVSDLKIEEGILTPKFPPELPGVCWSGCCLAIPVSSRAWDTKTPNFRILGSRHNDVRELTGWLSGGSYVNRCLLKKANLMIEVHDDYREILLFELLDCSWLELYPNEGDEPEFVVLLRDGEKEVNVFCCEEQTRTMGHFQAHWSISTSTVAIKAGFKSAVRHPIIGSGRLNG